MQDFNQDHQHLINFFNTITSLLVFGETRWGFSTGLRGYSTSSYIIKVCRPHEYSLTLFSFIFAVFSVSSCSYYLLLILRRYLSPTVPNSLSCDASHICMNSQCLCHRLLKHPCLLSYTHRCSSFSSVNLTRV